ncbi:MAG TPA: PcfJ domain-containing protein [Vicinamibacterales bacterium]|nr:PcfJ domain-containing protein [Vicinamibacterales bacterium]
MSSAERFVRHHKQQTDRAISQAYARVAASTRASATFRALLHGVRNRAPRLLDAPVVNGHHSGVDALVNLSRFRWAHIRAVGDWQGTSASWRPAVYSLAQHLIGRYTVPAFLAASWYAVDDVYAEKKREWFVAHAHGASFRSLDLPIEMTRKMEHIFLTSRDHLAFEHAMRRAELLALGGSDELVRAVLATRSATDLRHGAFWRTVWMFLIANARAIEASQIGPMIDFIQAIRHERVPVETRDGIVLRDPPQPSFSMKGRTVRSMMRLMQDWHRSLGLANGGLTWAPSPLQPMMIEEPSQDASAPPSVWQLMELTNGAQLRAEGTALRHCVASYADRCWRGASRIWALRVHRGEKVRHVLTVEVDMKRRTVVQARGWGNRAASGKPLRLLHDWTVRERLRLAL